MITKLVKSNDTTLIINNLGSIDEVNEMMKLGK